MSGSVEMPEAEVLVQGYLEGSLTEQESERLLVLLRQEPSTVDQILWGLRDDQLIRAVLAKQMVSEAARPALRPGSISRIQEWWGSLVGLLRGHTWVFGTAAGVAMVVVALWLAGVGLKMGEPVLSKVEGSGLILERKGESTPAREGLRLYAGDSLRTPDSVAATISFSPEQTQVRVEPGTDLRIANLGYGKRFDLTLGKIQASVAHQRPFRPMIVRTPHAEARVVGTKFSLTVSTNATRLDVTEGKVRLTQASDRAHVDVAKDQYAIATTNAELTALPQTGSILYESWTNIPGNTINHSLQLRKDSRYPDHPDNRQLLQKFEASPDQGTTVADRFRGYLHPPSTSNYVFTLDTDDDANLWLSPGVDSADAIPVAATAANQETKLLIQQSVPLPLIAGRVYYIEVTRDGGKGSHHLAVYWQLPDGSREIIPGKFLSPVTPKNQKETKP